MQGNNTVTFELTVQQYADLGKFITNNVKHASPATRNKMVDILKTLDKQF